MATHVRVIRQVSASHCDIQCPAKMPKLFQNRDAARPGKEGGTAQALLLANTKVVLLRY